MEGQIEDASNVAKKDICHVSAQKTVDPEEEEAGFVAVEGVEIDEGAVYELVEQILFSTSFFELSCLEKIVTNIVRLHLF